MERIIFESDGNIITAWGHRLSPSVPDPILGQGCGITRGFSNHCDSRESPLKEHNRLWKALSVVSQWIPFPTACLGNLCRRFDPCETTLRANFLCATRSQNPLMSLESITTSQGGSPCKMRFFFSCLGPAFFLISGGCVFEIPLGCVFFRFLEHAHCYANGNSN